MKVHPSLYLGLAHFVLARPSFAAGENQLAGVRDLFDKGGFVMMMIVGLSVVGVAFALERLIALRKARLVPAELKAAVEEAVAQNRIAQLSPLVEDEKTPLARILKAGLNRAKAGFSEMERSMESQGSLEAARLKRPIKPIGVLAQVEPLLGLLGTILGMITTFNLLHTTTAAERVSKLAPGIGQALYTTAAGLAIAIPFVLIHHHLQGRVSKAVEEWSVLGTQVVNAANRTAPVQTAVFTSKPEEGLSEQAAEA